MKQPAITSFFGVNSTESNREQGGIIGGQGERQPFFEVPMIDQSGRPPPRRGPSDPLTDFLGSLIDMCGKGLSAWEALVADRRDEQRDQALARFGAMASRLYATAEAGQVAVSEVADMSPAIAQAYGAAITSLMRYWSVLAELHLRHQASLIQAARDQAKGPVTASPTECRLLADELRAFLREIGDASTQEARRLQQELEKIGESIARAADEATSSQHQQRRRHEVKE